MREAIIYRKKGRETQTNRIGIKIG